MMVEFKWISLFLTAVLQFTGKNTYITYINGRHIVKNNLINIIKDSLLATFDLTKKTKSVVSNVVSLVNSWKLRRKK